MNDAADPAAGTAPAPPLNPPLTSGADPAPLLHELARQLGIEGRALLSPPHLIVSGAGVTCRLQLVDDDDGDETPRARVEFLLPIAAADLFGEQVPALLMAQQSILEPSGWLFGSAAGRAVTLRTIRPRATAQQLHADVTVGHGLALVCLMLLAGPSPFRPMAETEGAEGGLH